jgi:hypothetical protein
MPGTISKNLIGPGGRLYADPTPSADKTSFQVDNTSAAYYNSAYYLAHQKQVQPIPPPRKGAPMQLNLKDFIPKEMLDAITAAGTITFHMVGDTGAAKVSRSQTAATALGHETAVADAMVADVNAGGNNGPAFFFHLGDVIYNFGEAQYYYDQFYEPFREYDRPIFAIPGNHDGMVFGTSSSAPQVPTLAAFLTNFCAGSSGPSPDAGTLVRDVMTQPAVYFTLDAPFISIIGLYSNVLDVGGGGVISSQNGKFPLVDDQLDFLTSELQRLKQLRKSEARAVAIAVHHPPLSADAKHGGSTSLSNDIDSCCKKAGLWPDAVFSGHAHLYQRFTRNVNSRQSPYLVAGSGGFAATPPQSKLGQIPLTIGDATLEIKPIIQFGYLTVTVDAKTLTSTFYSATRQGKSQMDSIILNLATGQITSKSAQTAKAAPAGKSARPAKPPKTPSVSAKSKKPTKKK